MYRTHHFRIMIYDLGGNVMTPIKIKYSPLKNFKNLLALKKKSRPLMTKYNIDYLGMEK